MNENLKAFLKYASEHEEVVAKFDAFKNEQDEQKIIDATITIAKEYGFELTADDFAHEELSEEELQAVAGGWEYCWCLAGGGGSDDADGKVCACVLFGQGNRKDNDRLRCYCILDGGGHEIYIK